MILLVGLIKKFGFDETIGIFKELGWRMVWVLLIPLLWYLAHSLGWFYVLEETGAHVSLWDLLKIKIAGESVNTLTPVSFMGGDPVRMMMLYKKMPGTLSTASVVLDRTMITLAIVPFLIMGLIAAWMDLNLPPEWKWSFPGLLALLGFSVWFFIHRQKRGMFDFLSRILTKLGFERHLTENIQKSILQIDQRISEFYSHGHGRFWMVLGFHFLARLFGVLEIYVIARFLDLPLGVEGALYLASLTILVNMIFVFIPGSLGVLEGAYGALFHLMGMNPALGVGIQLVRRARTFFWIFVGLAMTSQVVSEKVPPLSRP